MSKGVLIVVENLPVPFDRRVWQEALALHAGGYRVCIICPTGRGFEKKRETLDGIEIYRHALPVEAHRLLGYLAEYSWALVAQALLTIRICVTGKIDVLHACNPPDTIFLIGSIFRLFGKKFVFDHHDICPELFEAKFGHKGIAYKFALFLERCSFTAANISIATNESYARIAVERGGMKPENVYVVRSGPDLSRVKAVPANPELKRGRRYLVAYVGVMGRQEGLDLLLESIDILVHRMGRQDVQFGLVGGGTELPALRAVAASKQLDGFVTFTGRVPDQQLFEMLSTADVCVNPDRVNEMNDKSTMNKILEYMAVSKPIVQFDLAEGRVSAEEASLYAKPNDPLDFAEKIAELLDQPGTRQRMGALGRKRIEESLSWEHQSKELLRAYAALYS